MVHHRWWRENRGIEPGTASGRGEPASGGPPPPPQPTEPDWRGWARDAYRQAWQWHEGRPADGAARWYAGQPRSSTGSAPQAPPWGGPPPYPPPWAGGPSSGPSHGRRRRYHWWQTPADHGPLRRSSDDRILGGVAAGLSRRIGVDVTVVRVLFILGSLFSGVGFVAYVIAWLLLPVEGQHGNIAARALGDWRGIALALGFLPLLVLALIVSSALSVAWLATLATPVCLGAGGLVLVYRNVPDEERAVMQHVFRPLARLGMAGRGSWEQLAVRLVFGILLAVVGAVLLLAGHHNTAVLRPVGGLLFVVAGIVVVFGPWWLHIIRDLVDERQARARAEERADIAARVHDSVLQTLALIQRRADQPQQVVQLARAQERELRSWLFEGRVPGAVGDDESTLAVAISRIQTEIEATHGVPVEAVVVGDCELDDHLRNLLEAGREAVVNAAKWSGAPVVSLFVEVDRDSVEMFVRDRGRGFDPASVPADRRGLAESIEGRMARHGGSAVVRSVPGDGTEVELRMGRTDAARRKPAHQGAPGMTPDRAR